jgi:hypothetical protein
MIYIEERQTGRKGGDVAVEVADMAASPAPLLLPPARKTGAPMCLTVTVGETRAVRIRA